MTAPITAQMKLAIVPAVPPPQSEAFFCCQGLVRAAGVLAIKSPFLQNVFLQSAQYQLFNQNAD